MSGTYLKGLTCALCAYPQRTCGPAHGRRALASHRPHVYARTPPSLRTGACQSSCLCAEHLDELGAEGGGAAHDHHDRAGAQGGREAAVGVACAEVGRDRARDRAGGRAGGRAGAGVRVGVLKR
eukprot:728335-Pleurochrysis_carterae.AAC.1